MSVNTAMSKISVSKYSIRDKRIKEKIRIVQLTDMHTKLFGDFNSQLSDAVKKQEPDIIVITGDMCTRGNKDYTPVTQLLEELVKITKVYYALGNHELDYKRQFGCEMLEEVKKTGAVILDNEIRDIKIKGTELILLGLTSFKKLPNEEKDFDSEVWNQFSLIDDFSKGEGFKIMLCHYPEYVKKFFSGKYDRYFKCGFDLMLSGHAHGGLVRLPLLGGLVAPHQGLFPKYDKGMFQINSFKLIVSAGLGDTRYFFRVNNPREISVTELDKCASIL